MYTGPKLTNDNLVFGYDTGYYSVFSKAEPLRFYKGEPATNAQDSDISAMTQTGFNNWGAYDGNNTPYHTYSSTTQTKTLVNIPGPDGKLTNAMLYHNVSGGSFGPTNWSGVPSANLANGKKITLQAWVKAADSSFVGKSVRPHLYYNKVGGGSYSASTNHSLTMDWQLVKHCYTVPEGATGTGTFYLFTGSGETKMYVTQTAIVPDKLHSVVWLQGGTTRSDTASLIDLKKTTDIDVGNVSFGSTGQPEFDGTDDCIDLNDTLNSMDGAATFEMVFKATETNDNYRIMLGWGNGSSNYSGIHIGSWTSGYTDESFHVTFNSSTLTMIVRKGHTFYKDNQYHHAVVTTGVNSYSIWIDGVEQTFVFAQGSQSTVFNNIVGYNSNIVSHIGKRPYGGGSGYFKGEIPVMKVYDAILTETEIKQNYNAYKNRFNI